MTHPPEIPATRRFWRSLRHLLAKQFTAKFGGFLLAQVALLALFLVISPVILRHLAKDPQSDPHGKQNTADEGLGIKVLIEKVRAELDQLDRDRISRNEASLLYLDTFDLEISFVAQRTDNAKGEVNYEVITVDSERSVSSERVQRLTLHYKVPEGQKGQSAPSPVNPTVPINTHGPTPPPLAP